MAVTVTTQKKSIIPIADYVYNVTGLVNGINAVSLPTPPAAGSFPPLADWTPTTILCFPFNQGAVGALVTPDLASITNTNGLIAFNLWANGTTSCLIIVI